MVNNSFESMIDKLKSIDMFFKGEALDELVSVQWVSERFGIKFPRAEEILYCLAYFQRIKEVRFKGRRYFVSLTSKKARDNRFKNVELFGQEEDLIRISQEMPCKVIENVNSLKCLEVENEC